MRASGLKWGLLCHLFAVSHITVIGQINEDEKYKIIEQRIELIAEENEEDEIDYSHLQDLLENYFNNPLDLNRASRQDLEELELLTIDQINSLLNHKEKFGPLLSIYELQTIPGFTKYDFDLLGPFIAISRSEDQIVINPRTVLKNGKHEFFIMHTSVLEEQKGYSEISQEELEENPNRRYLGSQSRIYSRYRFRFKNNISIGLTGEKDPGEEFFQGSQSGFDFYSGHLYWNYPGKIKKIALGDYHAQFGQGLTVWSGLAFGKSSDLTTLKKNARGISPYASVDENIFLRGVAITGELSIFEWTLFGSSKRIDANLAVPDTNAIDPQQVFTNFQTSGFHRTPAELIDKDAIPEKHFGGNVSYKKNNLKLGFTALASEYEGDFQRNLSTYNQFEFSNPTNNVIGFNYDWTFQNMNFFGEMSRSKNGGLGTINGALISLDPKLSISILYRNIGRDFHSILSNVPIESSRTVNEKGVLLGIDYHPKREWKVSGYFDRFEFPWLRFLTDAPSYGYDSFVQTQWRPSRKFSTYLRYRYRSKAENVNDVEATLDYIDQIIRTNVRWHVSYKISSAVELRNRIEWHQFEEANLEQQNGFMLYQDVIFQPLQSPITLKFRYALFDTDSYDSRIYAFESDLIYTFSIPAYYYRGARYYAMVRYKVNRNSEFWVRFSRFDYTNRTIVGSGLNEIQSNQRTDLKLLLRLRF